MLGYESERRIASFLIAVGQGERDTEFARSRLCMIPDFAPNSAFQRIDRDGCTQVSNMELNNFLRDNGVYHVSDSEMQTLVEFFDTNGNRRLDFQEVLQTMLPCEDNGLRNRTLDRPARYVGRFDRLPTDIELGIVSVLEKEIQMQRRLESLKRELESRPYDYNIGSAFRAIDRYNMGRIDSMQLGTFLRANGHYLPEMELIAIIRRFDTDGDAVISYGEFSDFMRPAFPSPTPAYPARPSTPPRRSTMANSSPLKTSSPARASSANRTAGRTSSPMRASPSRTSPSRKPILGLYDEDALIHGLKDLCNNEQELEQAKIRLGT